MPSTATRGHLLGIAWAALGGQALLFGAPLLFILWLSLLGTPETAGTLSANAWANVFASSEARQAIFNSVTLAGFTALLAPLLALPLAYLIGFRRRFVGRLTLALVLIIWLFDPGMRILGWMQALKGLGMLSFVPDGLLVGLPAELIASLHAWTPPAALLLSLGFARVDPAILNAARECGANGFTLMRRVLWPLNRRLTALAVGIVFAGSIGSFLEPRLLGSGEFEQATEWLQRALESETGWPYAAIMLLLLLGVSLLPLIALAVIDRRRRRT